MQEYSKRLIGVSDFAKLKPMEWLK